MPSSINKKILLIVAAGVGVWIIVGLFYFRGTAEKPIPSPEEQQQVKITRKLPPKIAYEITKIQDTMLFAEGEKGEIIFSKEMMEKTGIYTEENGARVELTFADLAPGQKMVAHTEEGTGWTGFEIFRQ
jgi:hypothetical protein